MVRNGVWGCLVLACISQVARAEVRLPAILGDNMVLQRDTPLTFWGWAEPGEEVSLILGEDRAMTKADRLGEWLVKLNGHKADGTVLELVVQGQNTIRLKNIVFGEVWLGSGQSNMAMSVEHSAGAKEEVAAAKRPMIRLYRVHQTPSSMPASDVQGTWQESDPRSAAPFSAVLYSFGRELHEHLEVPVGLIEAAWGGTRIEAWIPPRGFESPELAEERRELQQQQLAWRAAAKAYSKEMKSWLTRADALLAEDRNVPTPPPWPGDRVPQQAHAALYQGMIHPLTRFPIRGIVWYQGEANVGQGMHYSHLMGGLVSGWRRAWDSGDLPFFYVQLAPYKYRRDPLALPALWEAQAACLELPNTGMVVTTDIGNVNNVHPVQKREVGRRLSLWALAQTYGKSDLVFSGPIYESMSVDGQAIRIKFRFADGGLISLDDRPLTWFTIAGQDKKFVAAQARIDREDVLVSSPDVTVPIAVRFGWHETAEPNLANSARLPASPFRTDGD